MDYFSTRGGAPAASFEDALLAGLAPDGGLYLPHSWPVVSSSEIEAFAGRPYSEVAANVLSRFTDEAFPEERLRALASEVYAAFDHKQAAPLTTVGDEDWILELYHGPTLAFKDFALQILGRMFDDALARRGRRLTIIVATSGDTGAAAIDALKGRDQIDLFVLHPKGRVTGVQRRMMTTIDDAHVHNIAIDGSFDDCQAIVKTLFADQDFVARVALGGVNSINWARIAAQTVYYFTACAALRGKGNVNFVVPTGNFGDVFAGYVAKCMGAPIAKLGVATNRNDILHRALTSGAYKPVGVTPTSSPSMDIQVASNFERLLFDVLGRDSTALRNRMEAFAGEGAMILSEDERAIIATDFISYAVGEGETLGEIKRHFVETGALIDPHTAVARCAARALREKGVLTGPIVTLSTAHPAKFPEAVEAATGQKPALPQGCADLFDRDERMERASADAGAVKAFILGAARAGRGAGGALIHG